MLKLCIVAGARPNFMKIAPIIDAITAYNSKNSNSEEKIDYKLVHTGQHYDEKMSKLFFDNLGIPTPDVDLEVGSSSHAVQTAETMKRFEPVCLDYKPDYILVVGDVNSTIACALVASKMDIKVIHVEAGLRSFDRTMPEEINRLLTDAISDVLFITEESGEKNLLHEGVPKEKIYFVGNVMIDTLIKHKAKAEKSEILKKLGLINKDGSIIEYAAITLHRPSNVDNKENFSEIIEALLEINLPIIFPVHPRTRERIERFGLGKHFCFLDEDETVNEKKINCIPPLGYLDFLHLVAKSRLVLTDSGGIQEETTILGVPCVTLRENTERPVTTTQGTNIVAGTKKDNIIKAAQKQLSEPIDHHLKQGPPLWDGKASERIVDILSKL